MRRFVKEIGMSPPKYIHALRLEEAKQLLETTDFPIEVIANQVAGLNTSFLSRLFRGNASITPLQYSSVFGSLRAKHSFITEMLHFFFVST